jgi:hypothetical protein
VGRFVRGLVLTAAIGGTAAGSAAAHVDVLPAESVVNEAHEFVIRVPSERDVPTSRVRITFARRVIVVRFATAPGWTRRTIANPDGTIGGVVYEGGRIDPDEYAEFRLLATPIQVGTALWKVEQTYADGVTKPWTGPPEKEGETTGETGPSTRGPAPATRFVAKATTSTAAAPAAGDDSSPAGIWLGVIAIGIAGAAAAGVGFLWSSRPMPLPPDDGSPAEDPEPEHEAPTAPSPHKPPKHRRG